QTYDDKGNVIVYRYQGENSDNVDLSQINERNRTDDLQDKDKANRTANRYLKRIYYGNREPYLPVLTEGEWPQPPEQNPTSGPPNYYFEVIFDYDDGHYRALSQPTDDPQFVSASVAPSSSWPARLDAFSTYRAGFEVRTYRLCQRILMFHHIPDVAADPA